HRFANRPAASLRRPVSVREPLRRKPPPPGAGPRNAPSQASVARHRFANRSRASLRRPPPAREPPRHTPSLPGAGPRTAPPLDPEALHQSERRSAPRPAVAAHWPRPPSLAGGATRPVRLAPRHKRAHGRFATGTFFRLAAFP